MTLYNRNGVQTGETFELDRTLTEQGHVADAKASGDAIAECYEKLDPEIWLRREPSGYFLQYNIMAGDINSSTGAFVPSTSYWVTDYIPVEPEMIYIKRRTAYVYYYDSSKTYLGRSSYIGDTWLCPDTAAYVRVTASNGDKDLARFVPYYLFGQKDIRGNVYKGITENATDIVGKGINDYADSDTLFFDKTENQFNFYTDWVQFSQTGKGISRTDGTFLFNDSRDQSNEFSSERGVSPIKYFEVSAGQTLTSNKRWMHGAYYNENYEFVGNIGDSNKLHPSFYAPEGCAYVRLNFYPMQSLDDVKGLTVFALDNSAPNKRTNIIKTPIPQYQIDGDMISSNYLDKVVPSMAESEFLSAAKCLSIREANRREHALRYGTFNIYVGNLDRGYDEIKRMLMDYGIDFCGFQEVNSDSTTDLASFLHSWQFPYGFYENNTDGNERIDKTFVSTYPVLSSQKLELPSSLGLQSNAKYLNCKVQLPRYNDVYEPFRVLSVYIVHLPITSSSLKVQVAQAILNEIATDTSDFVIIGGDMNDFGDTEETKDYWRTFEAGGFRPVIPIDTKTITTDTQEQPSSDPSLNWRKMSLDQFCISSNIQIKRFGVVNTKDHYWNEECAKVDNEYCLSDHDFVWADFVFDYETPRTGLHG